MSAPHTMLLAVVAQPDPIAQPAPTWMLWTLLMVTFFLHMIAMNWVVGGSVIAAVTRVGAKPGSPARSMVDTIARSMPSAVAATITLGVAPLLFIQVLYGRVLFTSSILMGWFWLSVIPLLVLAYYGTYLLSMKGTRLGAWETPVAWLTALFFVGIGFLYSNNMTLMLKADTFVEKYLADGRGFTLALDDPQLVPRYLHMMLGAIAVAGMILALVGVARRAKDAELGRRAIRRGTLWFVVPTALNVLTGTWWLMALPRETMLRFMGQNQVATISFGVGFVLGLGVLIMMILALFRDDPAKLIRGSAHSLVVILILMVLMRDQVRRGELAAVGFEPAPWVEPQWGPIAIFLLLFVAGLAVIAWMLKIFVRAMRAEG